MEHEGFKWQYFFAYPGMGISGLKAFIIKLENTAVVFLFQKSLSSVWVKWFLGLISNSTAILLIDGFIYSLIYLANTQWSEIIC